VARKYTNEKKRATFVRHRFAIVTLARGNARDAGSKPRNEQPSTIDGLEDAMKSLSVEPSAPKTSPARDGDKSDFLDAESRIAGQRKKPVVRGDKIATMETGEASLAKPKTPRQGNKGRTKDPLKATGPSSRLEGG